MGGGIALAIALMTVGHRALDAAAGSPVDALQHE